MQEQPPPTEHPTGSGRAYRWLAAFVFVALLVRLPLLAADGHGYDLSFFAGWTDAIHQGGLSNAQNANPPVDYPAFPYLLWPVAEVYGPFIDQPAATDDRLYSVVKLPGILGDLAVIVALFFITRRFLSAEGETGWGRSLLRRLPGRGLPDADRIALLAAVAWGFNPAVIYVSAYWGQIDSLITLAMLGSIAATLAGRGLLAGASIGAGLALKPQVVFIAPVVALGMVARRGVRSLVLVAAGACTALALALGYFVLAGGGDEIVETYSRISGYRLHVSYNAWNIWWPAEVGANPTPGDPVWEVAGVPVTYQLLGLLTLLPTGLLLWRFQADRSDPPALFIAGAFSVLSCFMLATAVHERYLVYTLGLLVPVAVMDRRWALVYAATSVMVLLNVSASLPPHGEWARFANSAGFSMAMAGLNLVLYGTFAWLMFVRPGALRREPSPASDVTCYAPATSTA